ncbi:MAG TPA: energy transducer TonB [Alphaproteobacteria bacterium]|jgi:TonB family protein|nr:energy transducer TonB [Alphaproteobacteria bacterium]
MSLPQTAAVSLIFVALLCAEATGQASAQAGNNTPPPPPTGEQADGSVEGYVDFEFTVTAEGKVENPKVTAEEPKGYGFADSATKVFPQWRFQPEMVDGKPVATQAFYRFTFRLPPGKRTK